ncbi:MAG: SPOR domain-containing protein [Muricauda sp.]|uniref:Sporulation domain-containing protein n=1 Tax=Flagellimonas lutaonensis TaxID=516051 RepID=A0A0D5YW86_9FLAO|nr:MULTISPECIES: SPOR domain-containing protein [Allomuricauda]AKA36181.1 Sporulation domain-containing protein [Allomuricauda lutaonensis]MAU26121.1 SPOR domain-containing protein [Allomuricauda sp.]MBC30929.1 SPOR domain-containing protein [Allomuricauda sp.]|tara:strand:+ start:950 stop:1549 length:600 start_codon:yes stop_codon:yes gene_type:complete
MPFIEENDLLDLHKDVEKAQIINERLLDQIKYKNKDLKRIKIQRNVLLGVTTLFLIGTLAITSFTAGLSSSNRLENQNNLLVSIDSLDAIKKRIDNLKQRNEELSLVNEFYLAKKFLEKETIYSVQVKSFVDNNVTLASEALTNTLFVKTNPFYAYSLGNFETLEEARKFRQQLVDMGFKDAFVASYQDGKRVKIEDPY